MPQTRLLTFTLAIAAVGFIAGCPNPSTTSPSASASPTAAPPAALSPSPTMMPSPSPSPTMMPSPSPTATMAPSPTPSPSPSASNTATIMFKDGGELQSANVTIYQGGTVTWKNSDSQVHNIVPAELFDFRGTGDIEPSASSRAVLFNGLGTKAWYCTKHPDEKGTITVVEEEKQQPEDQQPEDQQP